MGHNQEIICHLRRRDDTLGLEGHDQRAPDGLWWAYCNNQMACSKNKPGALLWQLGERLANDRIYRCPECGSGLTWKSILNRQDKRRLVVAACMHEWQKGMPLPRCIFCRITKENFDRGWFEWWR